MMNKIMQVCLGFEQKSIDWNADKDNPFKSKLAWSHPSFELAVVCKDSLGPQKNNITIFKNIDSLLVCNSFAT